MSNLPTLLTVSEVAEVLRISKKTVYRWVYERCIPFHKINGKLLFAEVDVSNFIESSKAKNSLSISPFAGYKLPAKFREHHSRKGSLK